MKKLSCLFLLSPIILFTACVMTKTYTNEQKKMASQDNKVMIIKNNGDKIIGNKLTSSFDKKTKTPYTQIDGQNFRDDDLAAFQNNYAYRAKFGNSKNYMWVTELKRGKINLFYYEYLGGHDNDVHFIFQKGNGTLYESNITEIANMVRDNPEAYAKFTKQFGSSDKSFLPKQLKLHPKVLFAVIDIYNGT